MFPHSVNGKEITKIKPVCVFAEWEAVKIAEQAKDALSQQVSAETTAASNSQTDAFNQQVTMMPVQVLKAHCPHLSKPEPSVSYKSIKNVPHFVSFHLPPPSAPSHAGCSQCSWVSPSCLPCLDGYPSTRVWTTTLHQAWV